jgi:hypothetical protein
MNTLYSSKVRLPKLVCLSTPAINSASNMPDVSFSETVVVQLHLRVITIRKLCTVIWLKMCEVLLGWYLILQSKRATWQLRENIVFRFAGNNGWNTRLSTGRTVRGSNPGGWHIFHSRRDRPWGPPSGYRISLPGVKRPGRGVDHPPLPSAEVTERV